MTPTNSKTKGTHGGRRPGAGRKPEGEAKKKKTNLCVSPAFLTELAAWQQQNGLKSQSAALEAAARAGMRAGAGPERRPAGPTPSDAVGIRHLQNALKKIEAELGEGANLFYTVSHEGPVLLLLVRGEEPRHIGGLRLEGLEHYSEAIRVALRGAGVQCATPAP